MLLLLLITEEKERNKMKIEFAGKKTKLFLSGSVNAFIVSQEVLDKDDNAVLGAMGCMTYHNKLSQALAEICRRNIIESEAKSVNELQQTLQDIQKMIIDVIVLIEKKEEMK